MFKRRKRTRTRQSKPVHAPYRCLEERRLLSVTTLFESGELSIALDSAGDVAELTEIDGEVQVNGNPVDMNSIMDGIQPLMVGDVTSLVFDGADGLTDLSVILDGQFDTGLLQTIGFDQIHHVTLNGDYTTNQWTGVFVGDDGMVAGPGRLTVAGLLDVHSDDDFDFEFDNVANDFMGPVDVDTGGNITLVDSTDNLVLRNIAARNMTLNAVGTITNTVDPSIVVPGASNFTATVVNLGNNGGVVDLFAVISNTSSTFSLNEHDKFVWSNNSTVGFANISAGGLVSMGPNADITVNGDAFFDVDRLRIGVGGSNTFNAERINVNAIRNAFIWENSSTVFFGQNTAADIDIFSTGDITNVSNAQIEVSGITSFQAIGNVAIGNQDGDQFNSIQIRFFANDVMIVEDSETLIGGLSNGANSLYLQADGFIRDTVNAFVQVNGNATLISNGPNAEVTIGETDTDEFTAGTISFNVDGGTFDLTENDAINVFSADGFENLASNLTLESIGGNSSIVNDPDAIVRVDQIAMFEAGFVSMGQMSNDLIELGQITVNSVGNVAINLDGDVEFTGVSFVGGDLSVNAVGGAISDNPDSKLEVVGQAVLVAPNSIELGGDSEMDDRFRSGALRFVSNGGNVAIVMNSDLVLFGVNNAMTLSLETVGNSTFDISDLAGTDVNVVNSLFLTSSGNVDLGNDPTDSIQFDNLNFSAIGDIAITAMFEDESDELFIFGTSNNPNEADEFVLTTNVDVFDGNSAVIDVDTFFRIESRNLVLGDTETDCVMIPESSEFVTTDNPPAVTIDETCP